MEGAFFKFEHGGTETVGKARLLLLKLQKELYTTESLAARSFIS
jgi:hypothetical protein